MKVKPNAAIFPNSRANKYGRYFPIRQKSDSKKLWLLQIGPKIKLNGLNGHIYIMTKFNADWSVFANARV